MLNRKQIGCSASGHNLPLIFSSNKRQLRCPTKLMLDYAVIKSENLQALLFLTSARCQSIKMLLTLSVKIFLTVLFFILNFFCLEIIHVWNYGALNFSQASINWLGSFVEQRIIFCSKRLPCILCRRTVRWFALLNPKRPEQWMKESKIRIYKGFRFFFFLPFCVVDHPATSRVEQKEKLIQYL